MRVLLKNFFIEPNCLLSILSLITSISQYATKRSHILDKVAVSEIGRKSLVMSLGILFFGKGMTSAFFHSLGIDAC